MLMVASFLRTSKNVTAVEAGQLDEAIACQKSRCIRCEL